MQLLALTRGYIFIAALLAAMAVMFGAYASHGMTDWATSKQINYVQLASQYQLFHSIALLATALLSNFFVNRLLALSQALFVIGIFAFSGSLYYLVFVGNKLLVLLTPFGGVLLILAWLCIALAMLKKGK